MPAAVICNVKKNGKDVGVAGDMALAGAEGINIG